MAYLAIALEDATAQLEKTCKGVGTNLSAVTEMNFTENFPLCTEAQHRGDDILANNVAERVSHSILGSIFGK